MSGSRDEREKPRDGGKPDSEPRGKRVNAAPDAVKDPSVKTGGKPGEATSGKKADPGAG